MTLDSKVIDLKNPKKWFIKLISCVNKCQQANIANITATLLALLKMQEKKCEKIRKLRRREKKYRNTQFNWLFWLYSLAYSPFNGLVFGYSIPMGRGWVSIPFVGLSAVEIYTLCVHIYTRYRHGCRMEKGERKRRGKNW